MNTANSSPPSRAMRSGAGSSGAQAPADLHEQLVAERVAERVVHFLEAVEVDQQDRDRVARPRAARRAARGRASGSAGRERVVGGERDRAIELAGAVALQQRDQHEQRHEEQQARPSSPGATNATTYPTGNSNRSTRYVKRSADASCRGGQPEPVAVQEPRRRGVERELRDAREHVDRPVAQLRCVRAGDEEDERRAQRVNGRTDHHGEAIAPAASRVRARPRPTRQRAGDRDHRHELRRHQEQRQRRAPAWSAAPSPARSRSRSTTRPRGRPRTRRTPRRRALVGGASDEPHAVTDQVQRGEPGVGVRPAGASARRRSRGSRASSTARDFLDGGRDRAPLRRPRPRAGSDAANGRCRLPRPERVDEDVIDVPCGRARPLPRRPT